MRYCTNKTLRQLIWSLFSSFLSSSQDNCFSSGNKEVTTFSQDPEFYLNMREVRVHNVYLYV